MWRYHRAEAEGAREAGARQKTGREKGRIGLSGSGGPADRSSIKRREGETLVVFCFRIKVAARRRIDLPLPFLLR